MKKTLFSALALGMLLLTACDKNDKDDIPVVTTPIKFTQTNLFPEGVVYDKFNNRFYVSSVTRGTIGIVKKDSSYTPFITDALLTSTNGLENRWCTQKIMGM
jgi:hypothetical protein